MSRAIQPGFETHRVAGPSPAIDCGIRAGGAVPREGVPLLRAGATRLLTGVVLAEVVCGILLGFGCSSSNSTKPTPPPDRIQDLQIESRGSAGVMLRWSAPRAASGAAARYDVRMSGAALADSNWASADSVAGAPTPSDPGSADSILVGGLDADTIYHFAIRAEDSDARVSPISNDVTVQTVYGAPKDIAAVLLNFQRAWTRLDASEYARLFHPDFVFVIAPQDVGGPHNIPVSWGRATELWCAQRLSSRTIANEFGYLADAVRLQFEKGTEAPDGPEEWMKVVLSSVFLTVECHHESTGDPLSYLVEGDQAWLWLVQDAGSWSIARWEDKPISGLVETATFGTIKAGWR